MSTKERRLCETEAFQARLIHYAPGLEQADHEHARAQISFLLLGDAREMVGRREAEVVTASSGIKPAGIRHAASFGRNGALMLAFDFHGDAGHLPTNWSEPCRWRPLTPECRKLIGAAMRAAGSRCQDLLWDVLAVSTGENAAKPAVPGWVARARERIADAPGDAQIAAIAAELGIHRVHFARRFQQAYGVAPSVYRSRCMAARSAGRIVARDDFAQAALAGGFADQSHMTRTVKRHAGLTPSLLRAHLS